MSSSGIFVFGVELFLDSLLVLFDDFELFFGGVFHSFELIFEKVFEIGVSFIDLGLDDVVSLFLEFLFDLLNGILFDLLLLGEILFLEMQDLLPGLCALGSESVGVGFAGSGWR